MRTATALAFVALLLASGCTTKTPEPVSYTCPDGKVLLVPANFTAEQSAASCPKPAPATLNLGTVPADIRVYRPATFTWIVSPGNRTEGHSMLSAIRLSSVSNPDTAALKGPDSYGKEIMNKQHQPVPATFSGDYTFTAPGMYYIRAYARIQAQGLDAADYWTPEVMVMVADITPTGNNTVVTHAVGGVGDAAGKISPNPVNLHLGDGIQFKNDDVQAHTFTPDLCDEHKDAISVEKMATSQVLVFKAKGTCTFKTNDVQPQTLTVNIN